jgi:hypothetical protein
VQNGFLNLHIVRRKLLRDTMKKIAAILLILIAPILSKAQSVGINVQPAASAALDVASSSKGILIPRMNTAARNSISGPQKGLMVFDSSLNNFYFYDGSAWNPVGGSGGGTTLPSQTGNGGKFLTTDGSSLGWATGGPALYDNSGAKLGVIVGVPVYTANSGAYATIITSTGYIVTVLFSPNGTNQFPGNQIYWTGASCSGTPYFNNGGTVGTVRLSKLVVYSGSTGQLYTLANPDANGVSTSVAITSATIENNGICTTSTGGSNGYALAAVSRTTLGLPTSISYPLTIR